MAQFMLLRCALLVPVVAAQLPPLPKLPPLGGVAFGRATGAAAPPVGSSSSGGGAPPELPTLNLLGGGLRTGGAGSPLGSLGATPESATPSEVQQLQAAAVQSPELDTLCPGKQRRSTDVGEECWLKIWTAGGCKAANAPSYEAWHQVQSLEVLVADVVQWANLPDERHKAGCYGSDGPPANLPVPPAVPAGAGLPPLNRQPPAMPTLGGMSGLPQAAAQGGQTGPPPDPAVADAVQATLENPSLGKVCPGVSPQGTGVGESCWKALWKHVGCLEQNTPAYEAWHSAQTFQILAADAATWASSPSERHRAACYGAEGAARKAEL
mmetsp:Transcript_73930/g.175957  ORF Transcript_73930/g.175957 Transcript_73930/m.175957 type:complete len:324 (+) Transcript_73930:76-1047(+)